MERMTKRSRALRRMLGPCGRDVRRERKNSNRNEVRGGARCCLGSLDNH